MGVETKTISSLLEKWVRQAIANSQSVPLLGLSGSQGIGKTTALNELQKNTDQKVALLSLDDFYLTKSEREYMGETVHPLCVTRGAPGTHDIGLLSRIIEQLKAAGSSDVTRWSEFDKVRDDRSPNVNEFTGKPDAILLEGWLVGALPDLEAGNQIGINSLEQIEDPDGVWRAWQEASLVESYTPLWRQFDDFFYLCAPSFDTVFGWRCEQEETTLGLNKGTLPQDRRTWVERFIQHYERITCRILAGQRMPGSEISVDEKRSVVISRES